MWEHAKTEHVEQLDSRKDDLGAFREEYTTESAQKRCVALSQGRQRNLAPKISTALSGHLTDLNISSHTLAEPQN